MLVSLVPWRSKQALADHHILKTCLSSHEGKHAVWCVRHGSFLSWFLVPVAVDAHARQMIIFQSRSWRPGTSSKHYIGGRRRAILSNEARRGPTPLRRTHFWPCTRRRKQICGEEARADVKESGITGKASYRYAGGPWERRLCRLLRNACDWFALRGRGRPEA